MIARGERRGVIESDAIGGLGSETWSHSDGSFFARQWPEEQALLPGRTDVMGREEGVCLQANWIPSPWVIDNEGASVFIGVAYARSCIGQMFPRRSAMVKQVATIADIRTV